MQFRTLDLFAGIGGIRLGFEKNGFKTVFSNDYEEHCKQTYDLNFKHCTLDTRDLNSLTPAELPDFDFMLAGFPCQPFSIAGHRQGFSDKKGRGNLFFKMATILKEKKPTGFLLENVRNLEGHDKGNTMKVILKTLDELGYHTKYKVLNSMKHGGLPQNRERIFIIGFKEKKYIDKFEFPSEIPLKKSFRDLLEKNVDAKYYYNDKPLYPRLKDDVKSFDTVYQWRRKYVRENKSGVCPTLTANMGLGGHNVPIILDKKGIRKLTPKECFNLQGFPKSYKLPDLADSKLYVQAGNSVSVPVIKRIAKQILKAVQ